LDSSAAGERSRFSFMGDSQGPLAAVVAYDASAGEVTIRRGDQLETRAESIFDYLGRELKRLRPFSAALPFDFDCGFAGYLGYELKAECDGGAAHRASTPDAAFILADRLIAFDHVGQHTYLLAMARGESERSIAEAESWVDEMKGRLAGLPALAEPRIDKPTSEPAPRRSRQRYREDIEACKRYLAAGHSYEICLTNTFEAEGGIEPLALYRALRRANPAPFASYLRFGELTVLSSSPERFLSVDREGAAETRPIKGTSRRGDTPAEDACLAIALRDGAKSQAENVTIVDLMRNDLGRVCRVGSVEVPELMAVESYQTVHQLVSSVRGQLRPGLGPIECVRACFPPGSMTGAPKRRTIEIIDELEGEARGVYSGVIGYFGAGGACDLSVAIRTIVVEGERITIGAGGAIVVDSDPEEEIAEMLLKARASISALGFRDPDLART
jgi:para-aminobenzoate synthetase